MKKIYQKWGLSLVMTMIVVSQLFAQSLRVSGKISDETGQAVPGASILEKGTLNGTVTDANGEYSLNVAGANSTLIISFIGYKTQEIEVGGRATIDLKLEQDVTALQEVVVTGYQIDSRRELTGSVATVKPKDLTFAPTGNVEQMLQGRTAGVTVITNGQPGTTSIIRVRGFGAFDGNSPLYIVDGLPTTDIGFLNPDDVESVTVLKDAAAASIYGARAAAGVIIYTTKKAKKAQKLQVSYDNMIGFTDPGKGQDMMNPTDFANATWQAIKNTEDANAQNDNRAVDYAAAIAAYKHPQFGTGATPVIPDYLKVGSQSGVIGSVDLAAEKLKYNIDPRNGPIYQVIAANKSGTDWYSAITRTAPVVRQTLGFSGGGDNHRFYVGLSSQDQKGILLSNSFTRYAIRANTEFDMLKNLRVGENFQATYRETLGLSGSGGGRGIAADENDVLQAFRMPSIIPVYDVFGGYAGTAAKGFNNPRNPVANQNGQANNTNFSVGVFGNVFLEYDPIPGLTLRTSIGGSYSSYQYRNYSRWQYENSENNSAFGYGEGYGSFFSWTFTNTASYKKKFGDHSIDALIGQEALLNGTTWDLSASGLNPFSWDTPYINMSDVSNKQVNSVKNGDATLGKKFASYFGSIKYAYKDKYIVGAVVRRDGSSAFSPSNRYGVFPAVSVAWRVSAESFMASLPWINDLKIRGGWGQMGNSNAVAQLNQYSLYGGNIDNSSYDITGSNSSAQVGFYRSRVGNPYASWETATTKNIGIDGTLFGGKLDVIIDFWQKDTDGLLLPQTLPSTAGFYAASPSGNIGKMVNKGIDIALSTKGDLTNQIKFEAAFNGSFLSNEITDVGGGTYLTTVNPSFRGLTPIRNQLGYSLSSFYGYKVTGLFQDYTEVGGAPTQAGAAPGRFRYADINGDGKIDDNDRTFLGSPVPSFTGGFNFTLRYKNFDLSAYLYTSLGNKIFNASKWFTDFFPSFQGAAISNRIKNAWTPNNKGATIPVFESASNFSTNVVANSFYVEDGSYLRLQNITLGYTLPASLLQKLKLTKLRAFASTNNVFTITGYQGLDPQVGGQADTNFGIDVGNYPITRSWTFGVNLAF